MILHPWHEVEPNYVENTGTVDGIIEISRGSKSKYEVDKPSGLLRLDRVVFAAFVYPINYGFIPRSLGDDGDPLDILVLSEVAIEPLCLVRARIIGFMEMIDNGEGDEKIIAVAEGDMSVNHIQHVDELPDSFKQELKHFFMNYKTLAGKEVRVNEFRSKEEAMKVVSRSLVQYKQKFG